MGASLQVVGVQCYEKLVGWKMRQEARPGPWPQEATAMLAMRKTADIGVKSASPPCLSSGTISAASDCPEGGPQHPGTSENKMEISKGARALALNAWRCLPNAGQRWVQTSWNCLNCPSQSAGCGALLEGGAGRRTACPWPPPTGMIMG